MFEILDYLSPEGRDPYMTWLAAGNFGDCKPIEEGVWELRVDHGPGYRVYYAQAGRRLILLLAGGDKRKQQADIATALEHWHDWQRRRKSS